MSLNKRKIGIIGAGHVGSHGGYSLISQGLVEELVYIDVDKEKAVAQALDLQDSSTYLGRRVKVYAGNYSDIKDADILIVAAGPLPDMAAGQTDRQQTLGATVAILKDIIPQIKASGFNGIIVNISNPADVVTHYLQEKLNWNPKRILSTSTTLDSSRVRRAIAEETGYDQHSIYAYALGEHGESQFVPWSNVTVGGKPILELIKEQPERFGKLNLDEIASRAKKAGWIILGGKGSTEFGIGASIANVVQAIFGGEDRILPVSTLLQGQYGQSGVYASVPCRVNNEGIAEVIELKLTAEEQAKFAQSCRTMDENYQKALSL
ncbi:MAG: L-lactate dehydrogenase [Spirochaetia bacterium]|nr:L-lactate dehydrogenase [Spirochaetia bacterium]MDD7699781.1 L-lactate dehydrogenase [Spirochaetia bacterium]MDY4211405.1 L-lactate dehydrogenase [Treponema sp.]